MTIPRDLSNLAPGANASGVLQPTKGGTALTTFTAANNALYSTSASALTAGTLPVAAGGTGSTSLTSNNVLIGNGTGAVSFVAPGTNGNVLTSNGTTWTSAAPSGGGSWVYLSTVTASGAATADVETTFNSTYDVYAITGTAVFNSTGASVRARLKIGGSYITTATYFYKTNSSVANSNTYNAFNSIADSTIDLTGYSVSNANPAHSMNFIMYIHNPTSTSVFKFIYWEGALYNTGGSLVTTQGTGSLDSNTAALTGVRFLGSSGNISGKFRLYGIKNS